MEWLWLALLVVLVLRWLRPWAHGTDEDLTYRGSEKED